MQKIPKAFGTYLFLTLFLASSPSANARNYVCDLLESLDAEGVYINRGQVVQKTKAHFVLSVGADGIYTASFAVTDDSSSAELSILKTMSAKDPIEKAQVVSAKKLDLSNAGEPSLVDLKTDYGTTVKFRCWVRPSFPTYGK